MAWQTERIYCKRCLCYHPRDGECPKPGGQVLPAFRGTPEEYQIATRGQLVAGRLDDAMDGTVLVRWGTGDYRVTYSMGMPTGVELVGKTFSWADWD